MWRGSWPIREYEPERPLSAIELQRAEEEDVARLELVAQADEAAAKEVESWRKLGFVKPIEDVETLKDATARNIFRHLTSIRDAVAGRKRRIADKLRRDEKGRVVAPWERKHEPEN
jgi:hypothetical protein